MATVDSGSTVHLIRKGRGARAGTAKFFMVARFRGIAKSSERKRAEAKAHKIDTAFSVHM